MARPVGVATPSNRTSTGIPGLDPLIDGGFPANRAVILCGGTGTGKTTFALQFLAEGLERGEPGAFVSLDEKPIHLLEDAAALGRDLRPAADNGTLAVLDAAPYFTATRGGSWGRSNVVDARQVASDLAHQTRKINARRLVVDTLTSLVPPAMDRGQAQDYLRSLIQSLEDNLGCSILLTCRGTRLDPQATCDAARYLASGVIELRLARRDGELHRSLVVRKMRGASPDLSEHPLMLERGTGLSLAVPRAAADLFTRRQRSVADGRPPASDRPAAV